MVVDYKVAVNKDKATQTLGTIVNSIKTEAENGSFGNYNVDVASISATGKCVTVLLVTNIWGMATIVEVISCWP